MNILGFHFGSDDQPASEQRAAFYADPLMKAGSFQVGLECDELAGHAGEFGATTNPIPVNGIGGEISYIQRLRTANGAAFLFHRMAPVRAPVSPNPLDEYELVATDASEWRFFYFAPYHPRRSRKAPPGLHLEKWGAMSEFARLTSGVPSRGVNSRVENFPLGLPRALAEHPVLKSVGPAVGPKVGAAVQAILDARPGAWSPPAHPDLTRLLTGLVEFVRVFSDPNGADSLKERVIQAEYSGNCVALGREATDEEIRRFMAIYIPELKQRHDTLEAFVVGVNAALQQPALSDSSVKEVVRRARRIAQGLSPISASATPAHSSSFDQPK